MNVEMLVAVQKRKKQFFDYFSTGFQHYLVFQSQFFARSVSFSIVFLLKIRINVEKLRKFAIRMIGMVFFLAILQLSKTIFDQSGGLEGRERERKGEKKNAKRCIHF